MLSVTNANKVFLLPCLRKPNISFAFINYCLYCFVFSLAVSKWQFFTTEPFACDPSTLPKYPPSKEIDARRREEEARRRQALEGGRDKVDQGSQGAQESAATMSAKVNAEFVSSLQKKRSQSQSKSRAQSESLSSYWEESTSSPVFDSNRKPQAVKEMSKEIFDCLHQKGICSGPLTRAAGWSNAGRKLNDPPSFSRAPNLSNLSSFAPKRTSVADDTHENLCPSLTKKAADAEGRSPESVNDLEGVINQDQGFKTRMRARLRLRSR